ncbi:GNAT family N-acetyltransferase [Salinimicrobium profundisediminis]|jgi:GNAT superfamily N-acetyltransferase|uniref:GNAT family N-acetyltransferase n=1 Tax=Salinimicrobium profundisediminis TaxID=2994553 RepID=A0A9X3CZR0_9FLAO|nr:GNAT family N-acetyltransferase [Salinimicrobium profundisediminis]MCX2839711.1 GNAT family N-acetyltransferase [Salinimicrobium profundisediminis]
MKIVIANASHEKYAQVICDTIEESAKIRGTGIARRTPEYILTKMQNGNAVIALEGDRFAGFCYIEVWSHEKFVANSGLIVHPDFRNRGLAKDIKKAIFELSRKKYPQAKIFGITTGLAVMKINYELGYQPVTFSELTDDESFWKGCQTCKNYDILTRTERKMCLCTGMLYDPVKKEKSKEKSRLNDKAFTRLKSIKQTLFYKKEKVVENIENKTK